MLQIKDRVLENFLYLKNVTFPWMEEHQDLINLDTFEADWCPGVMESGQCKTYRCVAGWYVHQRYGLKGWELEQFCIFKRSRFDLPPLIHEFIDEPFEVHREYGLGSEPADIEISRRQSEWDLTEEEQKVKSKGDNLFKLLFDTCFHGGTLKERKKRLNILIEERMELVSA